MVEGNANLLEKSLPKEKLDSASKFTAQFSTLKLILFNRVAVAFRIALRMIKTALESKLFSPRFNSSKVSFFAKLYIVQEIQYTSI